TADVTEREGDVVQRPPSAVSEFVHRIGGVDPDVRNAGATQFGEQGLSSNFHSGRGGWLGTDDEQSLLGHLCHRSMQDALTGMTADVPGFHGPAAERLCEDRVRQQPYG